MIKNLQRYDTYTKFKSTCNFEKSSYMRMAPVYFCHVSYENADIVFTEICRIHEVF